MANETITTSTTLETPPLDADLEALMGGQSSEVQTLLLVNQLLRNGVKIMAAIDNLNTAVAAIQQNTANLITTLDSALQQLNAALAANAAANQDPAIQAAADALNKTLSNEQAALARDTLPAASGGTTASATASATPTATPSPAPAPVTPSEVK